MTFIWQNAKAEWLGMLCRMIFYNNSPDIKNDELIGGSDWFLSRGDADMTLF